MDLKSHAASARGVACCERAKSSGSCGIADCRPDRCISCEYPSECFQDEDRADPDRDDDIGGGFCPRQPGFRSRQQHRRSRYQVSRAAPGHGFERAKSMPGVWSGVRARAGIVELCSYRRQRWCRRWRQCRALTSSKGLGLPKRRRVRTSAAQRSREIRAARSALQTSDRDGAGMAFERLRPLTSAA